MEQGSIENARNREQPPDDSGGTGEEPEESASSLLLLLHPEGRELEGERDPATEAHGKQVVGVSS